MSREKFWFFYPLRVRYSEVDCQGVVFNANYLMYFDHHRVFPRLGL